MPEETTRIEGGLESYHYLESERAREIFARVSATQGGLTGTVGDLSDIVGRHLRAAQAARERSEFLGAVEDSDRRILDEFRGSLGRDLVDVIRQVIESNREELTDKQTLALSKLGSRVISEATREGPRLDFGEFGRATRQVGSVVGDDGPNLPHLESERAREIFEQISAIPGNLEERVRGLSDLVSQHLGAIQALQGRERVVGGLEEDERRFLGELRGRLGQDLLDVIRQVIHSERENLTDEQTVMLSRLGTRVGAASAPDPYQLDPFDLGTIRADVRIARSLRAAGELGDDYEGLSTTILQQLESHSEEMRRAYAEERALGDEANLDKLEAISRRVTSTDRLRSEIVNLFELNTNQQKNVFNTMITQIGTVLSTIGATQWISRFAISEPYQFGTVPALTILGQQGQMGGVLGRAYGELEAYNYQLNQQLFGYGAAATALGTTALLGGRPGLGIALSTLGLGMGALGLTGIGDEALRAAGFSVEEDKILGQALAKQLSDPTRLINEFRNARAGLLAVDAGANLGFDYEARRGADRTGNVVFDRILDAGGHVRRGDERFSVLRGFGYNRENLGVLLSTAALNLRDTGPGLENMAAFAGVTSGAFGISDEQVISAMQVAQRFGAQDPITTIGQYAAVFREQDGSIASYSMSVLVPALLRVTESMAIRSLARSTEELTSEVTQFSRGIIQGDTRLGELARINPEVLGRVLTGLQESAALGIQDPAMAALDLHLGSSLYEMFVGDISVAGRRLQFIANQLDLPSYGTTEEFLGTTRGITAMRAMQALLPTLDRGAQVAMLDVIRTQGFAEVFGEDGQLNPEHFSEEVIRRVGNLAANPMFEISTRMSNQVDEFLVLSGNLVNQLKALQITLSEILGSESFRGMAERALEMAQRETERVFEIVGRGDGESYTQGPLSSQDMVRSIIAETLQTYFPDQTHQPPADALHRILGMAISHRFPVEREQELYSFLASPENASRFREFIRAGQERYGIFHAGVNQEHWNMGARLFGESQLLPPTGGYSVGGYTGIGGRHEPAGVVHAGEYVISSDRVKDNLSTLERIQSGERVETSSVASSGNVTYLTMKIHGMSPEDIQNMAVKATENYIIRHRINYN